MTCGLMTHGFRGFWLYWHVVLFSNPWYCIIIWFCWRAFTISCTWVVGWPLLFLGLSTLSPCHLPLGFIELLSIRFNCSYRLMCFTRTIDLENCFIRVGQGGKAGRSSWSIWPSDAAGRERWIMGSLTSQFCFTDIALNFIVQSSNKPFRNSNFT